MDGLEETRVVNSAYDEEKEVLFVEKIEPSNKESLKDMLLQGLSKKFPKETFYRDAIYLMIGQNQERMEFTR